MTAAAVPHRREAVRIKSQYQIFYVNFSLMLAFVSQEDAHDRKRETTTPYAHISPRIVHNLNKKIRKPQAHEMSFVSTAISFRVRAEEWFKHYQMTGLGGLATRHLASPGVYSNHPYRTGVRNPIRHKSVIQEKNETKHAFRGQYMPRKQRTIKWSLF